jgi:hypothetical protein
MKAFVVVLLVGLLTFSCGKSKTDIYRYTCSICTQENSNIADVGFVQHYTLSADYKSDFLLDRKGSANQDFFWVVRFNSSFSVNYTEIPVVIYKNDKVYLSAMAYPSEIQNNMFYLEIKHIND